VDKEELTELFQDHEDSKTEENFNGTTVAVPAAMVNIVATPRFAVAC